jgi:hypothetical protein
MGMGLAFHTVPPEQLWVLQEWLGDVGGALPPEISLPLAAAEYPAARFSIADRKKDVYCQALSRLVAELVAQGLLTQEKGDAILQTLNRCPEAG